MTHAGWLLFMNAETQERRRLSPVPAGWREFDDPTLDLLLQKASVVARKRLAEPPAARVRARLSELKTRASELSRARAAPPMRAQFDVNRDQHASLHERLREMTALMADLAADLAVTRADNEGLNRELQLMATQRGAAGPGGSRRAGGRRGAARATHRYAFGRRRSR